ncbi:hypothetical protein BSLA_02f4489 [Burkholderia stabilis]|nr:hypothetical protein BSLA_02f4489 [Burkholderia stabilis]
MSGDTACPAGFAGHCVVGFCHGPWIDGHRRQAAGRCDCSYDVSAAIRCAALPAPSSRPAEKTGTDYRYSRPDIPVNRAFIGDICRDSMIRRIGRRGFNGV